MYPGRVCTELWREAARCRPFHQIVYRPRPVVHCTNAGSPSCCTYRPADDSAASRSEKRCY